MRQWILSLVVLALIATPAVAGKFNKKVSVGEKAPVIANIPAVSVNDNGEITDSVLNLDEIEEEVVVVVFLANHCPVVVNYEDRLIDLVNDYAGKSVKVLGLSVSLIENDKLPGIRDYMTEKGSNYTYGYDASQAIGKAYGATNTPQFFVLDEERTIRYMGKLDDNMNEAQAKATYVRDAIDALLEGGSIEVTETRPYGCGITYKN